MAFYDKYIPKELKNPIDDILDFGTDTFKKTGRAIRKLTPRELRPALPFLSAALPFMLPGNFAMMGMNPAFSRGIMSALANATSQEALDPEGDINYLSSALAGLTGAGATEGAGEALRGMRGGPYTTDKAGILSSLKDAPLGADTLAKSIPDTRGFFGKARDLGLTGLGEAADFLGGSRETLGKLGSGEMNLFSKEGAKALGKATAIPAAQGSGDLAYSFASKAMRDFEAAELEELMQAGLSETEMMLARRNAITEAMTDALFSDEDINATLDELGLLDFAQGGIASLKDGGMLDFGGREMDLRGGGFVPMGKKERADDVPARLSKNEFVMTADAVRAAGGGSVNKGAQRMYDIMNRLEARA
jgi:hypothetical protein